MSHVLIAAYGNEPYAHDKKPCVYLFTYANEISLQVIVRELPQVVALNISLQGIYQLVL